MNEQLITLVIAMREAQKAYGEEPTRANLAERNKHEMRVDIWIEKYIADKVQLELWTRSIKGSEMPGAYNVDHEIEREEDAGP